MKFSMPMRVLLDTNILIHREASVVVRQDIGLVFNWLDRLRYEKCIHPESIREIERHGDRRVRESFLAKLVASRGDGSLSSFGIFPSSGMIMRPEGLLRGNFLVLDIDPGSDLSFFQKGGVVVEVNVI